MNIGRRDLIAAHIQRVEGIFNTTTNYILCRMQESGLTFDEALCEAQKAGVAEADPTPVSYTPLTLPTIYSV